MRKTRMDELQTKRKDTIKGIKEKTKARIKKMESRLDGYEESITDSFRKARKNRLKKRIKKEEEKLYQLHNALGEDSID